jgi:hypothetical protein
MAVKWHARTLSNIISKYFRKALLMVTVMGFCLILQNARGRSFHVMRLAMPLGGSNMASPRGIRGSKGSICANHLTQRWLQQFANFLTTLGLRVCQASGSNS